MKNLSRATALLLLLTCTFEARSQYHFQTDFTAEEFNTRREAIYDAIGSEAIALIQGAPTVKGFYVFRQTNTFYYLCGLEVEQAYLLLDGRARRATLYLPHRDEGREAGEGKMLSAEDSELVRSLTGVDQVKGYDKMGLDFVWSYLVRYPVPTLYTPFSPAEGHLQSRDEVLKGQARQNADPWDEGTQREATFVNLIKSRYPQFEIQDLSHALDTMRLIKSKAEIDLIRKASQIAGFGIQEAIRSTEPGVTEFQLDAAANFVFSANGARSEGYRSITAGGTNAWMGHYFHNNDTLRSGDLVLMDIAPDYHYYTSDVARMWPVNGKFSEEQRVLYGFIVEYSKALIKHLRPGISADQVMDEAASDMARLLSKLKFKNPLHKKAATEALQFRGHLSHPVGMSVHDVGSYRNQLLRPGMVFSIDPMLWVPEERLYVRMEDVVVITKEGAENLSSNLESEISDIEKLIKEEGIVQIRPAKLY